MADSIAADRTTATLLLRISEAIASRSVPPLVNSFADHYDWRLTTDAIGSLWNTGPAPAITADPVWITAAWLTPEQFRFTFFRLAESALRHPETDLEYVVLEMAAEPVPRGSEMPPARFNEFSAGEIQLVAECVLTFGARVPSCPDQSLASERVIERALRNWKRFAACDGVS